ncbi:hypothetical protein ABIB58_001253 [Brevundimonas sp. UYEF29]|uniref:phage head-tail adapter protein n=1 Tax=Brevundimonas sp. UYEF29 TaxID=3156346 RepID=UPI00339A9B19
MRILAGLFQPVEAETPYGGRSVSFEAAGSAWLKCGARRRLERGEGDQRRAVETMGAEARADARLMIGRVLRFGGADWRIVSVEDVRPGRAKLDLERVR